MLSILEELNVNPLRIKGQGALIVMQRTIILCYATLYNYGKWDTMDPGFELSNDFSSFNFSLKLFQF